MSEHELLQSLLGDDYHLQWAVGHGGMSTVWLADDVRNEREVAIKVLRPEFVSNKEFLARFRNEALASSKINSPQCGAHLRLFGDPRPAWAHHLHHCDGVCARGIPRGPAGAPRSRR